MTSPILTTAMRLVLPITLLFGAYMAIKGHNEPGGGFIGGLIIAVALAMFRMTRGGDALRAMVRVHPRVLVFVGLAIALATAVAPMLLGLPLLTSDVRVVHLPFGDELHFASAAIFDIGVLLVVVGVSLGIITRFSEELERQGEASRDEDTERNSRASEGRDA